MACEIYESLFGHPSLVDVPIRLSQWPESIFKTFVVVVVFGPFALPFIMWFLVWRKIVSIRVATTSVILAAISSFLIILNHGLGTNISSPLTDIPVKIVLPERYPSLPMNCSVPKEPTIELLGELAFKLSVKDLPFATSFIVAADNSEHLLVTSRVEVSGKWEKEATTKQDLILHDSFGTETTGVLVGRHREFDIALLRSSYYGSGEFRQPIRCFSSVEIGEPIFIIFYEERGGEVVGSGSVAQKYGNGFIELSGPVGPHSSGAPVYDAVGNLIGIVVDSCTAISADTLLKPDEWDLAPMATNLLNSLVATNTSTNQLTKSSTDTVKELHTKGE